MALVLGISPGGPVAPAPIGADRITVALAGSRPDWTVLAGEIEDTRGSVEVQVAVPPDTGAVVVALPRALASPPVNRLRHLGYRVRSGKHVGELGRGEEQVRQPAAVAPASRGGLWIADTGNDRVQLLDHRFSFVQAFGGFAVEIRGFLGDLDSQRFDEPVDLVETLNRDLYVLERHGGSVARLDRDGRVIARFGAEPGLVQPQGMTSNSLGDLLVADTDRDRVVVFDRDGNVVRILGSYGWGPRQFRFPGDVAVDTRDRIHVADTGNARVQVFDHFGKLLTILEGFTRPRGLAVDGNGVLWVADPGAATVRAVAGDGRVLLDLARRYPDLDLAGVRDVKVLHPRTLLVVDQVQSRILAFDLEILEEDRPRIVGGGDAASPLPHEADPMGR